MFWSLSDGDRDKRIFNAGATKQQFDPATPVGRGVLIARKRKVTCTAILLASTPVGLGLSTDLVVSRLHVGRVAEVAARRRPQVRPP